MKLNERISQMLDKLMYYSNPNEPDYIVGTVGAIFGTLQEFEECLDNPKENADFVVVDARAIIKEVKLLGIGEEQELIELLNDLIEYFGGPYEY